MKNPHSHPAHRNVPDAPQADNPNMTQAAKDRSDKWAKDLDADDFVFDAKAMFPFCRDSRRMTD